MFGVEIVVQLIRGESRIWVAYAWQAILAWLNIKVKHEHYPKHDNATEAAVALANTKDTMVMVCIRVLSGPQPCIEPH